MSSLSVFGTTELFGTTSLTSNLARGEEHNLKRSETHHIDYEQAILAGALTSPVSLSPKVIKTGAVVRQVKTVNIPLQDCKYTFLCAKYT